MFRNEVTLQDAIVSVSLVESSIYGTAMETGELNALHTTFPLDPEEEYREQGIDLKKKKH
jgi:DNA helicase MCM9